MTRQPTRWALAPFVSSLILASCVTSSENEFDVGTLRVAPSERAAAMRDVRPESVDGATEGAAPDGTVSDGSVSDWTSALEDPTDVDMPVEQPRLEPREESSDRAAINNMLQDPFAGRTPAEGGELLALETEIKGEPEPAVADSAEAFEALAGVTTTEPAAPVALAEPEAMPLAIARAEVPEVQDAVPALTSAESEAVAFAVADSAADTVAFAADAGAQAFTAVAPAAPATVLSSLASQRQLSPERKFRIAVWNLERGHTTAALGLLAVACSEKHGASCNRLGRAYDRLGRADEAAGLYQHACELGVMKGCNNLGWLYERRGDLEQARAQYGKACASRHPGSCTNLARADQLSAAPATLVAAAEQPAAKTLQAEPRTAPARLVRAEPQDQAALSVDDIVQEACTAEHAEGCVRLATQLESAGDLSRATSLYRRACDGGDGMACFKAAKGARRIGQGEQALDLYERAMTLALAARNQEG